MKLVEIVLYGMGMTQLYIAFNIEIASEGHKHYRDGWVNVECPYCTGTHGYHLGFNEDGSYYYCFRCGYHHVSETLQRLLNISHSESLNLADQYAIFSKKVGVKDAIVKIAKHPFTFPSGMGPVSEPAMRYLRQRNFDPDRLQEEYELQCTGPISYLHDPDSDKKISYKFRIVIPIYWDGRIVSFQTRDYTGKQSLRYKACPMARERVHHKYIIYGKQKRWEKAGIAVEGVFDVWRFGESSFATFGTGFTQQQIRVISKQFKRVFTAFDPEPAAQVRAEELRRELNFRGVETQNVELKSDPADMPQEEADYLIRQLSINGL